MSKVTIGKQTKACRKHMRTASGYFHDVAD